MKGKLTFLAWFSGKKVALHINNVERHRLAKVFEVLPERSVNVSLEEFAALCRAVFNLTVSAASRKTYATEFVIRKSMHFIFRRSTRSQNSNHVVIKGVVTLAYHINCCC